MRRDNPTQRELNRASACRALEAMELSAGYRMAIRPIRRHHLAKLAALVAASPIGERRTINRRAIRAGR